MRQHANWETGFYSLLVVVALAMRLWHLGERAMSHDEILHGLWSWYLSNGQAYNHDPMMHGPFLFHSNALVFLTLGDSDFTVRLLPALFGTALVALPYLLRRQLGRLGALSVAVMLAFSPMLLYYGRYARNDIYVALWIMLLVVCLWRYVEGRKARYLYIGAAALSFSFCTKETTYITTAIFGLFLLVVSARGLAWAVRRRFDFKELTPLGDYFILIGTLTLPLYSPFVQLIPGAEMGSGFHWGKVIAVVVAFGIAAAIGLRWQPRRWLWSALIFYGVFALLYTSFFRSPAELGSGIWGSVDYWIEQHSVARGGQPWFYYLQLLPVYEFLPMLFAAIGAIFYAVKGKSFARFLICWGVLSLVLFSYAGEKMPWLAVHIALPSILLGGMFIGRIFDAKWAGLKASIAKACAVFALLLLLPFTVYGAAQASYDLDDDPPQMLVYAGISSDVSHIMAEIEETARQRGEGQGIKVIVDSPSPWTWPWYWNLRHYTNVEYRSLTSFERPPAGAVLLIDTAHRSLVESYSQDYTEGQDFRDLIWFPEEYRDFDLGWWWRYFLLRDTKGPYWSSQGVAYFPVSSQ